MSKFPNVQSEEPLWWSTLLELRIMCYLQLLELNVQFVDFNFISHLFQCLFHSPFLMLTVKVIWYFVVSLISIWVIVTKYFILHCFSTIMYIILLLLCLLSVSVTHLFHLNALIRCWFKNVLWVSLSQISYSCLLTTWTCPCNF